MQTNYWKFNDQDGVGCLTKQQLQKRIGETKSRGYGDEKEKFEKFRDLIQFIL